jgi:hypothetical protein
MDCEYYYYYTILSIEGVRERRERRSQYNRWFPVESKEASERERESTSEEGGE